MERFSLAILQIEQRVGGTKQARVADVVERLRAAPAAHLILLPELWDVGWPRFDQYEAEASGLDAGPLTALSHIARERSCMVVAGSTVERTEQGLYNTAAVLGPDGRRLGAYRKRHLATSGGNEAGVVSAGAPGPIVFDTPLGRMGLGIGSDLRFPDHFAAMRADEVDIIVVPAHWPASLLDQLRPLAQARAIETQTPVIVANGWGPAEMPAGALTGGSIVIDARGGVVAEAGDGPGWLQAEIDLADMRQWRMEMPMTPRPRPTPDALPPPQGPRFAPPPRAVGPSGPPPRSGSPSSGLSPPAAPPGSPGAHDWSPPAPPAAPSGPPSG